MCLVKQERPTINLFFKFAIREGFVKQVHMYERTQFAKAKRVVCSYIGLEPADVCFLFQGRELEPHHRSRDVNMPDGAVVLVLDRSVVHPPIDSVIQELASQHASCASPAVFTAPAAPAPPATPRPPRRWCQSSTTTPRSPPASAPSNAFESRRARRSDTRPLSPFAFQ
jgi:hypothetical protein